MLSGLVGDDSLGGIMAVHVSPDKALDIEGGKTNSPSSFTAMFAYQETSLFLFVIPSFP